MDQQESRTSCNIQLQFGEVVKPSEQKTNGQIEFFLSKESYEIQKITLQQTVQGIQDIGEESILDIDYSLVFALKIQQDRKQFFLQTLETILQGHDQSQIAVELKHMIDQGELQVKYCEGCDGKIYISLKIGAAYEELAIEQLKMYLMCGLENISMNQMNSITLNFNSGKTFQDYLTSVKQGNKETISSFLSKSSFFNFNLDMSNNFTVQFLDFIRNLGMFPIPEISMQQRFLIQKLNKCSLKFQFSSTAMLEDYQQKNFFNWIYKFQQISINRTNEKVYVYLMECIEPEIDVYITIPDLGAMKATINSEGFLDFFKYFAHPE